MSEWKQGPKAKIYEALSAVNDGRVRMGTGMTAEVISSDGEKMYEVIWTEGFGEMTSNDSASYWQGYMGYPMIAVLMAAGRVEYEDEVAKALSGIGWKSINRQYRGDYDRVIKSVLDTLEAKGMSRRRVEDEVERIEREIALMRIRRLGRRRPPPKKGRPGALEC